MLFGANLGGVTNDMTKQARDHPGGFSFLSLSQSPLEVINCPLAVPSTQRPGTGEYPFQLLIALGGSQVIKLCSAPIRVM